MLITFKLTMLTRSKTLSTVISEEKMETETKNEFDSKMNIDTEQATDMVNETHIYVANDAILYMVNFTEEVAVVMHITAFKSKYKDPEE